jgi:site-specific DNA-methyltransferase (adenine-specific)
MNKDFDKTGIAYNVEMWKECLRILKPGGYLLSFGATRTYHRMACSIEDAGFEIRDCLMYLYGSGFPKSHNVGLGIDKHFGHSNRGRAIPSASVHFPSGKYAEEKLTGNKVEEYIGKTDLGKKYSGYGTALKPAYEPIVMCRKPFKGTVAKNVLEYGTGGINIDGCRIECNDKTKFPVGDYSTDTTVGKIRNSNRTEDTYKNGRFPANILHDGSDEVLEHFPHTKSGKMTSEHNRHTDGSPNGIYGKFDVNHPLSETYGDSGSAARFFYCSKANKKDRNEGCESLEKKQYSSDGREVENETAFQRNKSIANNNHPTVKPTSLMRYLVRLVCPEGGTVLDPFNGSGSTGKAAVLEGFDYIGIEMDKDYIAISECRLKHAEEHKND